MAYPPNGIATLKHALDDLGTASAGARLQLHLLALEARERRAEIEHGIENLDSGLHRALATAADKARQLTRSVQDTLKGHPPAAGSTPGHVGNFMMDAVYTCSPEDSLARAAQIMWEHDCGAVPVLDAEGRPCAMITDRDVCMGAYTRGVPLSAIRVADVMSRHVQVCSAADTLVRAIAIMAEAQIRRLPVVGVDGRLAGVLSLADVVRGAPALGRKDAEQLLFQLLAALSKRPDAGLGEASAGGA